MAVHATPHTSDLLNAMQQAIIVTDASGHVTYWNHAAERLSGWLAQEALGQVVGELLSFVGYSDDADHRFAVDDVGWASEGDIVGKDGRRESVAINQTPLTDANGAVTSMLIEASPRQRDMSELEHVIRQLVAQKAQLTAQLAERAQLEADLRASEGLLRNVLDTLPVGVWMLDRTGRRVLATPAGAAIWGGERPFGEQHYVAYNVVTGERIEGEEWAMWRALRRGESTLNEMLDIETFDGEQRTVLNSALPIREADGSIIGAIAVNQDISEQRRAQQAEQEERRFATALSNTISRLSSSLNLQDVLEAILENIGQVVPHDAANISLIEGDIARPVCWRGYSAEASAYFEALRYPLTTSWIERMLATGEADLVNDVTVKPGWPATPALAWLGSVLSVPVRAHETIIGFLNLDSATLGFFSETHRDRLLVFADQAAIAVENARLYTRVRNHAAELEERVRERTLALEIALAKEKELSELKSRFVSMVSHEFRTPLASIQTSTDLLVHYFARMTRERRNEALLKIQYEIKRLTTILENVLTFGRAEAVGVAITPLEVDLVELCRRVVADVKRDLHGSHEIEFLTNCAVGQVRLDEKVMRHALNNLLENAVKYSPLGSRVKLALTLDAAQATLAVTDRGIGIDAHDRDHVFEPFHRGTNVGNVQGTGLGLVIVKHAVEAHSGRIEVQSAPGQGTTFTVMLPRG